MNINHSRYHSILQIICLCVIISIFPPSQVYSSQHSSTHHVVNSNSHFIISSGCSEPLIIIEGHITSSNGESLKLLPGTHIKGDEPVKIIIVSTEYQERLVKETAEENLKKAVVSSIMQRKHSSESFESLFIIRAYQGSRSHTIMTNQSNYYAILPFNLKNTFSNSSFYSTKNFESQIYLRLINSCRSIIYFPIFSWGSLAKTIAVMRT